MRPDDLPAVHGALSTMAGVAYCGGPRELGRLCAEAVQGAGIGAVVLSPQSQLLGVAMLRLPDDTSAELAALWVDPAYRRRGLARALLASLGPVWANLAVTAPLPERVAEGTTLLLEQFGLRPPGPEQAAPVWRTRRIRRTTGRAWLTAV